MGQLIEPGMTKLELSLEIFELRKSAKSTKLNDDNDELLLQKG